MKIHVGLFNKVIAFVVVVTFLCTSTLMAVPQNIWDVHRGGKVTRPASKPESKVVKDPESLVIPEAFGSVKEKAVSPIPGTKDKWILEIQDSHCNFEAQTNIRNILDFMCRPTSGAKLDVIAMEGAKGNVDVSFMRRAPDEAAKEAVTERFVKAGYFTGVEAYAIRSKEAPPRLVGAEEKDLYFENLDAFRKACRVNDEAKPLMDQAKRELDILKENIFSGPALEFLNRSESFALDKITLTEYVQYLRGMAIKSAQDLAGYPQLKRIWETIEMEEKMDPAKVDQERKSLIEKLQKKLVKEELSGLVQKSLLYRVGKMNALDFYRFLEKLATEKGISWGDYPNLKLYIRVVEIYADFRLDNLTLEIEQLEEDLKAKVYKDHDQHELDRRMKNWRMLQSLLDLKLSRKSLAYYQSHKEDISPSALLAFLEKKGRRPDALTGSVGHSAFPLLPLRERAGVRGEVIDPTQAERFYDLALKRDLALVTNALKSFDDPKVKTIAMVTGGFHSEGMKEIIRQKGYSYAVITPRITRVTDEALYKSIMLDEEHAFGKLLDRQGNRLAPLVRSPNALLSEEQKNMEICRCLAAFVEMVFRQRLVKNVPEETIRNTVEKALRQKYGGDVSVELGEKGPQGMLTVTVRYGGSAQAIQIARVTPIVEVPVAASELEYAVASAMPGEAIPSNVAAPFLKGAVEIDEVWLKANPFHLFPFVIAYLTEKLSEYRKAGLTLKVNLSVGDALFHMTWTDERAGPQERDAHALLEKDAQGYVTGAVIPLGALQKPEAIEDLKIALQHERDEKTATDHLQKKFPPEHPFWEDWEDMRDTWIRRVAHNIAVLNERKPGEILSFRIVRGIAKAAAENRQEYLIQLKDKDRTEQAIRDAQENKLFELLTADDLGKMGLAAHLGLADGLGMQKAVMDQAKEIKAQAEILPARDLGSSAVQLFQLLLSDYEPSAKTKILQSLSSRLPAEGAGDLAALDLRDPLIARELLYQLLEILGGDLRFDPETKELGVSSEVRIGDIPAAKLISGINSAFATPSQRIRLREMALHHAIRRDTRPLADRAKLDEQREDAIGAAIIQRIFGKERTAALSDAEQRLLKEDVRFLSLLAKAYLAAEDARREGKAEPMVRLDAGILAGKTEAEQDVYMSLLERLAAAGMIVSVENYQDEMEEGLAQRLARLEELNHNVSVMPKRQGRDGKAMMEAARARLVGKRPGVKIPGTYVGHFLQTTLQEYFTKADLAAFSVLLVQNTRRGLVELNAVNLAIAEQMGVKTVNGTLELLPEVTKDRKFIDELEEAVRSTAFQA